MELTSHLSCGFITVFLFLSICCSSAQARPIDQPDKESSQNQTNLSDTKERLLNESVSNNTSLKPTSKPVTTIYYIVFQILIRNFCILRGDVYRIFKELNFSGVCMKSIFCAIHIFVFSALQTLELTN